MATRSKNFKGLFFVKTFCVLLSILCSGVLSFFFVYFYENASYIANETVRWSEPLPSFAQSEQLKQLLDGDVTAVLRILQNDVIQTQLDDLEANKEQFVEKNTKAYLNNKAIIIHDELYYVATHYESSAYDLEPQENDERIDTTTSIHTSESVTPSEKQTVPVDERAPYNVRFCQNLLNTVSGLDYLKYAYLVREQAFCEQTYCVNLDTILPEDSLLRSFSYRFEQSFDYLWTEAEAKAGFAQAFDEILYSVREEENNLYQSALFHLQNETINLKYLIVSADGTIESNMPSSQRNGKAILAHETAVIYKNGHFTAQGVLDAQTLQESNTLVLPQGNAAYLYLENTLQPGDKYFACGEFYTLFTRFSPMTALLLCIASALLLIVCIVCLLILCGRKSGDESVHLCFTDKIPVDVHFLLSGGVEILLGYLFFRLFSVIEAYYYWEGNRYFYTASDTRFELKCLTLGGMVFTAILFTLVFIEWLTSFVRIKKAHQSWLRRSALWRIPVLLWKGCKIVLRWMMRGLRKVKRAFLFLLGKPKKIRYTAIAVILVFAFLQGILLLWCVSEGEFNGFTALLLLLLWGGFGVLCVWYLRMIDRIIEASCDRSMLPVKGTENMPKHLQTLSENLSVTSRELDEAVAKAVRNERTKAELITNVSHDLKTPLTSVISYVDLLKKCDITDETALGYLGILDEKSAKLKRLIEDLIEASKVNTGNVKLEKVPLNLSELSMQAVVEMTPDFEKQNLDIRFTQPETAPIVYADGTKTYRILENLLSNAKKYSAPGSRVYVRVEDDAQYGVFEIKNISKEPLDLTPQELTERFVRGDRSRSEDGNGLGLSIAQQLCILQGGDLNITIDGDLFKVTVTLPKKQ